MTTEGEHSKGAVLNEYPGSELSISELSYALKIKLAQGRDSRCEHDTVTLVAGNSFDRPL